MSKPATAPDDSASTAIRRHEERLARDPTSLVFAQLADLYRKAGRIDDAIAVCREGLVRYPHYTTARLILAKALGAADRLDEALAETEGILALSPRDVQVHRLAADLRRRRGDLDGAIRHLEIAVKLDAGDRESRTLLALLRAEPAAETTGIARVLRDETFVTVPFGMLCLEQGLTDEAAQVFTRVLRKHPDHTNAREGLELALRARSRRKG